MIKLISFITIFAFSFVTNSAPLADYLLAYPDGSGSASNVTDRNLKKYAQALQESDEAKLMQRSIQIKVEQLKDSTGLVYIGGYVSKATLLPYLDKLKNILQHDFVDYRANQAQRDHHSFHITLINPFEYQKLDKNKVTTGQMLSFNLVGLGKAEKPGKAAYFVIANSNDGQFYRQQLLLKPKDFHVTLGFKPQDVFGVSKGADTLIE